MDKDIEQRALEWRRNNPRCTDEETHFLKIVEWAWAEATEKALEDAALRAETEPCMVNDPLPIVVTEMERMGVVETARAVARSTKKSIAKAIRSLKTKPEARG